MIEQAAVGPVAGEAARTVEDRERAVRIVVDAHPTLTKCGRSGLGGICRLWPR